MHATGALMNIRRIAATFCLFCVVAAGTLAHGRAQAPQTAAPAKPPAMPAVNSQIGGAYPIDELEHTLTYTLESVSLASRFAAADRNVVAAAGKRLLIATSSVVNIQTHVYPLSSEVVTLNVFAADGARSLSGVNSFILPGLTS